MPPVNFATQSYRNSSLPISAQDVVNCFAEKEPEDAKTPVALLGAPGLELFATCGTGPIRNMRVVNDLLYVVSGSQLYSVDKPGIEVLVGSGIVGTGPAPMADNGTQIIILSGANGYIYNTSTAAFTQIDDPNFYPANSVFFFDGYFVLTRTGTINFFFSATLDGTTYNALDFDSALVQSDYVVALVVQQENLLIFKERTIETWYDSGDNTQPFARYSGQTVERGCAASGTPIKEDNSVFFLGEDIVFYRLDGVLPRRISTHAIEAEWQGYLEVADAFCFSFTYQGHKLIVLTFPSALRTFVYDISTGLWHRRESLDALNRSLSRWRGNCAAQFNDLLLIGDAFGGNVGMLAPNTATEYGQTMRMQATAPSIQDDRKRVFMSRFELDVEAGVGAALGQGSEPQIMLDYSDDGGRSFNTSQPWQTLGRIGAYLHRCRWLRLGQFRQRVMRITITDPVRRTILRAHADLTTGM